LYQGYIGTQSMQTQSPPNYNDTNVCKFSTCILEKIQKWNGKWKACYSTSKE